MFGKMFSGIGAVGAQLATTVVILSHGLVDKAIEAGVVPPAPVLIGAAAVCTTSYVVKKINRRNRNDRRSHKPKDDTFSNSYSESARLYSPDELLRPSSPVSRRPAPRHALPHSSRSCSPVRSPLTQLANGYIDNRATSPIPPLRDLSNQFTDFSNNAVATYDAEGSPAKPLCSTPVPYSPTGSFTNALTPSAELPDNTDHLDDYDSLDGDDSELRQIQRHQAASRAVAKMNQPGLAVPMTLDALVQRQLAVRAVSRQLTSDHKQLVDKENVAAIEDIK